MVQSDITVLSQPNDKELIKQFFYQVPLIERAKPLIGELIWILQDRPDMDMHENVLPDYCYNVMDVFKRTLFKSFPLLTDTIYVMDQAGLESAKNVEEAKKSVRVDWRNLGRLSGLGMRCARFSELEAQEKLKEDGFDTLPPDEMKDFCTVVFGREWVTANEAMVLAVTPDQLFARMLQDYLQVWLDQFRTLTPQFANLAYQWSPQAMAEFNAGMAEGMSSFLRGDGELKVIGNRFGIYSFLVLMWPEINAMLVANPQQTVSDLHEWLQPFIRREMVANITIEALRDVCEPPPRGIGLSLRPLKVRSAK